MKYNFLTHSFVSQEFTGGESFSGWGGGQGVTRRLFIKRTGGATVAAMLAGNMIATQRARGVVVLDLSGRIITTSTTIPSGPSRCPHPSFEVLFEFMHEEVKYERVKCRACPFETVRVLV